MNFDIEAVRNRLNMSQEKDEREMSERGHTFGEQWAVEQATASELRKLSRLETGQATWSGLLVSFESLRESYVITDLLDRDPKVDIEDEELMDAFAAGLVEGALAVWEQV